MDKEERLSSIVKKALGGTNYTLEKLTFGISGGEGHLDIVVDRVEPISLDDIVKLSEAISQSLDKEDPIDVPYNLDISSLGAEKPLKIEELDKYVGNYVNLHLTHPYKGENILEGTLQSVNEEVTLTYNVKGRKVNATFPKGDIDKARLAIKF